MRPVFVFCGLVVLLWCTPGSGLAQGRNDADPEVLAEDQPDDDEQATTTGGSLRRSGRMEFDSRLVRGETAGTGAVVLFNRGQRRLPELTDRRRSFLAPTVREVYGRARSAESSGVEEVAETGTADEAEERVEEARRSSRARRRARAAAVRRATGRRRGGTAGATNNPATATEEAPAERQPRGRRRRR